MVVGCTVSHYDLGAGCRFEDNRMFDLAIAGYITAYDKGFSRDSGGTGEWLKDNTMKSVDKRSLEHDCVHRNLTIRDAHFIHFISETTDSESEWDALLNETC